MLPRKTGKPIAFKCTEELRQQTEAIADRLGKSLSDYVREAVEAYNTNYEVVGKYHDVECKAKYSVKEKPKQQFATEQLKELERASGKPDKEFRTFFKGK